MNLITDLLSQISLIENQHREVSRKSGEEFDIFDILGLSTKETRLHSRFLAHLLRPNGSHGARDLFLKAFIEQLKSSGQHLPNALSVFDTADAAVDVEYHLGAINSDMTLGGRIDILIRDKQGRSIVIENKIYARDQQNQLVRYNSLPNKAALVYLTPKGGPPDPPMNGLIPGRDFICLSYEKDVRQWLQAFLDSGQPLTGQVEYTIRQYINTIHRITEQSKDDNMNLDIISAMTDTDEAIQSAFLVTANIGDMKIARGQAISKAIITKLADNKVDAMIDRKYSDYFPYFQLTPSGWKNHLINFTEDHGLFYGIKRKDVPNPPHIEFERLRARIPQYRSSPPWWLCYEIQKESPFDLNTAESWQKKLETRIVDHVVNAILLLIQVSKTEQKLCW